MTRCANGGEGGIRTLGCLTTTSDFESGAFNHSATSPDHFARPEGTASAPECKARLTMSPENCSCIQRRVVICGVVMQILSVLIGLVCAVLLVPGLIPLLGWLQWAVLAGCVLGIIVGSFCQRKIGLTINVAVALVAALRLFLGGGLF